MTSIHRLLRIRASHPITQVLIAVSVLASAILCSPRNLTAQATANLTGRITDRQSGQPLAGAHISVPGTGQGTVSRSDGTYRLSLPAGRHPIFVNYLGYAPRRDTVTVAAGETVTGDYALDRGIAELNAAVIIGTRSRDRTVLNSPVPVDVLTPTEIRQTGQVKTSQIIQLLAPSFNFPRPTVADGTDHIRPSTLRGLGPDQVLVLVNGKRRHTSSLVNVNGTIGRGSTGVDLNAIPASAIERIEILRDGAAAQYGSDAIAGVINIILKSDPTTDIGSEVGSNYTTLQPKGSQFSTNVAALKDDKITDGDVTEVDGNTGVNFPGGGFFHVTGQWEHRGSTNRSLPDMRTQYFAGDARHSDPNFVGQNHFRQGDAIVNDIMGFFNSNLPKMTSGAKIY